MWYEEIFFHLLSFFAQCTRLEQIFIDPIHESCTKMKQVKFLTVTYWRSIIVFFHVYAKIRLISLFSFQWKICRHECERWFIKIIHKIDFFSQIFTRYSRQTLESLSDSVFTLSWLMNVKFLIHKINFFNMLNMIRRKKILGYDKEFFIHTKLPLLFKCP